MDNYLKSAAAATEASNILTRLSNVEFEIRSYTALLKNDYRMEDEAMKRHAQGRLNAAEAEKNECFIQLAHWQAEMNATLLAALTGRN
jgi:hypothetical protein